MNAGNETAILERAVAALRAHGLTVKVQPAPAKARPRADAWLRVGKGQGHGDYTVEIKRRVAPATVGAIVAQLRQFAAPDTRIPLLVTDYLTPPMAEQLRVQNQQFIDAAGNAYLEGPHLFVYVVGRKPIETHAAPRPTRAFATAGLKLLFALMCDPGLEDAPYRTLATAAGVALGAVPRVLADLRELGLLVVNDDHRRLFATKRLLDEWALMYARRLRDKTLTATYVAGGFDRWKEWAQDPREFRWGGEPAAHLLVRHLRPGVLTVYADKLPARLVVEQRLVRAGPLDQHHLLEVRKPFWGRTLQIDDPRTVPAALVYADLLATGDARCMEAAQLVYERDLARFFPAA
jgi:hypothetical protein